MWNNVSSSHPLPPHFPLSYLQSSINKTFQRCVIDSLEEPEIVSTMLLPGQNHPWLKKIKKPGSPLRMCRWVLPIFSCVSWFFLPLVVGFSPTASWWIMNNNWQNRAATVRHHKGRRRPRLCNPFIVSFPSSSGPFLKRFSCEANEDLGEKRMRKWFLLLHYFNWGKKNKTLAWFLVSWCLIDFMPSFSRSSHKYRSVRHRHLISGDQKRSRTPWSVFVVLCSLFCFLDGWS